MTETWLGHRIVPADDPLAVFVQSVRSQVAKTGDVGEQTALGSWSLGAADLELVVRELRAGENGDACYDALCRARQQHRPVTEMEERAAELAANADPPAEVVPDVPLVTHAGTQESVDGLDHLLDHIDHLLERFISFPRTEHRHAVTVWVMHAWAIDAFESTPRLAVLSPEKGSGKTRVLELIELLVPNALFTVNISAAALFRKISEGTCTLLLDEADTYLAPRVAQQHEELRGLVNAGHRRGAVAFRAAVGSKGGVTVEEFPAFAPVALAGIGDLPDTILDRSVLIAMKRRAPGDQVESFRRRKVEQECDHLVTQLEAWAAHNAQHLEDVEPDLPDGIVDRPADVWEPLIVIGDAAGPTWSSRIRAAAVALNEVRQQRDPSFGIQLLTDIRRVFTTRGIDRLTTEGLLEALVAIDEAPWGDLRGKQLDARGLARRLRPYEIRSTSHRFGDLTRKGYLIDDFHDAFARYLPSLTSGDAEHEEHPEQGDLSTSARPEHREHPEQESLLALADSGYFEEAS